MRAVILAGGRGRRLHPYTITFPKPMVPVGDMPILEIVVRQLKSSGFSHVTLAVGHLAELLQAYFKDGANWGIQLDYSREQHPLGTAGPLLLIDNLPENFLVMNGDVLTSLDYRALFQSHLQSGAALTIACYRCTAKIDLGVIEFDGHMQVTGYREKPLIPYDASMGVYVFNRRALSGYQPETYLDFPNLVLRLVEAGERVKVHLTDCEWLDIGRPSDYELASDRYLQMKEKFLPREAPALSVAAE